MATIESDAARAWRHQQELVNAGLTVTYRRPGKDRGQVGVTLAMGETIMVERHADSDIQALRRAYETWWPRREW